MKLSKISAVLSVICCLTAAPIFADEPATKFDKAPMPVRTPPPDYPQELRGTEGMVSLLVVINEDGSVAEAIVTKSTNEKFEAPSLAAIAKWKFKPAELNGQPVKAKITVPIRFTS